MPDFTREDKIIRGNEANRLLNDAILKAVFAELEQDAFNAIVEAKGATQAEGDEIRRLHAHRIAALRDVREALQSIVTTGRIAAKGA